MPNDYEKNRQRTNDNVHGLLQRTKRQTNQPEKAATSVPNLKFCTWSNCKTAVNERKTVYNVTDIGRPR